ncbi:MAG: hypothetical protein WD939_09470 [Dehalococcoidia bacterium]
MISRRKSESLATLALEPRLYKDEDFERALSRHVGHAAVEERPYAVVACVPQLLPGENFGDAGTIAAQCIRKTVRDTDLAGLLGGEIVIIGLPETGPGEARSVAHRVQCELGMRSSQVHARRWEWGVASLNDEGRVSEELLESAVASASTRTRRLGD